MTRRPRPAAAARVLAGGLSASAAFAMVGGLALGERASATAEPVAPSPAPAPKLVRVVVRVHRPNAPSYPVPPPRPVVRRRVVTVPPPAPVTVSHGSR